MPCTDDLVDFDAYLQGRITRARAELIEALAEHRLTLREARVHRVLIPMIGVYTPGWQALPAWSWEFVELVTNEGPVGVGEWSVGLDPLARDALARLRQAPETDLLSPEFEVPLGMAWWDLVGKVLDKPLHLLWAQIFEIGFASPTRVPLAAYSWPRFSDRDGNGAVTFQTWPEFAATQVAEGFGTLKLSMTSYEPDD